MTYSARLLRPLKPKGHASLRTLADARDYLLSIPKPEADRPYWQHTAKLVMDAAADPSGPSIAAATRQIERALFVSYRLDMSTGDAAKTRRSSSRSAPSTRAASKSDSDSSH